MPHEDDCKMVDKLVQIHGWAHKCLGGLTKQELHQAHDLGQEIINFLNEKNATNGMKFIALFEALAVGADVLEAESEVLLNCSTTVN